MKHYVKSLLISIFISFSFSQLVLANDLCQYLLSSPSLSSSSKDTAHKLADQIEKFITESKNDLKTIISNFKQVRLRMPVRYYYYRLTDKITGTEQTFEYLFFATGISFPNKELFKKNSLHYPTGTPTFEIAYRLDLRTNVIEKVAIHTDSFQLYEHYPMAIFTFKHLKKEEKESARPKRKEFIDAIKARYPNRIEGVSSSLLMFHINIFPLNDELTNFLNTINSNDDIATAEITPPISYGQRMPVLLRSYTEEEVIETIKKLPNVSR